MPKEIKKTTSPQCVKNAVSGSRFVPMLFSTAMVKAIDIDKTKTETRRIIKHKTEIEEIKPVTRCLENQDDWNKFILTDINGEDFLIEPKVNVNDVIWVRETFQEVNFKNDPTIYLYKANPEHQSMKWKPSLFMPKDACRIFLKCVSVHAERLQDIDEQSAIKEGIEDMLLNVDTPATAYRNYMTTYKDLQKDHWSHVANNAVESYMTLWQKINGVESWNKNPFVWVYKFERIERPNDFH